MLYVCDLWIQKRDGGIVIPHGSAFLEFKHYPTNNELIEGLSTQLPLGEKGEIGTSAVFGIDHYSAVRYEDWWVIPTNLRALPKVRNKEKYLKNGKE